LEEAAYRHLRSLIRAAFIACLAGVLFFALGPQIPGASHLGNDKTQHFLAFFALAGLGVLGWRSSPGVVAVGLLLFGGAIELVQGTHFIGRDMSLFDWVADAGGMLGGMMTASAARRLSPFLARSLA